MSSIVSIVDEHPLDPADYSGSPPEMLLPGSMVFHMSKGPVDTPNMSNWWTYVPDANWRRPKGARSNVRGLSVNESPGPRKPHITIPRKVVKGEAFCVRPAIVSATELRHVMPK